jgi:hypothetical protein
MPDMELTNDSIVSFMVLVKGKALNNADLQLLYDFLVTNEHDGMEEYNRIFLGQPVQYGEKSFIRLSIGSYAVRNQLLNKRFEFKNDLRLIEIIEESVNKLFETAYVIADYSSKLEGSTDPLILGITIIGKFRDILKNPV